MSFGILLRRRRVARHLSQLDLALSAAISSRHLSCIETGRSQPSREMVLRLAAALQVPIHERNALLLSAGYAPIYPHAAPNRSELEQMCGDVNFFVAQLEPNPVFVLDRYGNILRMNGGAKRMLTLFPGWDSVAPLNAPRLVFHPHGLRPFIANWEMVATRIIQRVHHESAENPSDDTFKGLLDELLSYPHVPSRWRTLDLDYVPEPFLTVHYRWKDSILRLFSALTTLTISRNVAREKLSIESLFPADESARTMVNHLAEEGALAQMS